MLQSTPVNRGASNHLALPDPMRPHERRVLSESELAQRWRSEGRGPHYLKLSKRITYPLELIAEYERSALHAATSERVSK